MDLITSTFPHLYTVMKKKGHIPEELFDQLGYEKDTAAGKIIERNHGIEHE